ncbi:MAG TPA: HAD family hydrolase [Herpetosiphonaceae bacterium]
MTRLILWDIDGTLIRGARATAMAFNAALRHVYELTEPIIPISYGGKTDGQIVRETMALHRLEEALVLERLPAFEEAYLAEVRRAVEQLRREITVLPGVAAALAALKGEAVHGLLTGNLLPTARIKLEAAGLEGWFDWECSAFGSDHHQRSELVPVALRRAAAAGFPFAPEQTVVIGDTANDIACARAGGARAVAVATGHVGRDALAECAPDALLDDLSDVAAVRDALFG